MEFSKYQAIGNDFIIINGIENKKLNRSDFVKKICDRHFGVGADGFIICNYSENADVKMDFYNADGSKVAMCGNGIRCFSKFIYENNIVKKNKLLVETEAGIKEIFLEVENDRVKSVTVDMGKCEFSSKRIPCNIEKEFVLSHEIVINDKKIELSAVLVGVPHVVIFLDEIENMDFEILGQAIENHSLFPEKINVNFVKILNNGVLRIKTWERGVGKTLGCGTGCCAVASVAKRLGKIKNNDVQVISEGGELTVILDENYNITLKGDAKKICSGEYNLSE